MSSSNEIPAPKVEGQAADLPDNPWGPDYPEQVFAEESASNHERFTTIVAASNPELIEAAERLAGLVRKA